MEGTIKSEIKNGIGTITFYHPQSNSMPGQQLRNLALEIEKLGKDENAKVIVLKSEGDKAFCAGASFDELISIKDKETGLKFFSGLQLFELFLSFGISDYFTPYSKSIFPFKTQFYF